MCTGTLLKAAARKVKYLTLQGTALANFGFLIDNKKCIGCHACSTACKSENSVPLGVNRTWVKYVETGSYPDTTRKFQVTRCNHCANPPCVKICPVTAMYQRPDGIVEFDKDLCIGCKACIQACPYDAIYIDPENGTAAKCHYCAHRTDVGLEPACVVVCPEHAILAGDLDDPQSEIAKAIAKEKVTVRKPEQGTRPKLFYIDGDDNSLVPTRSPSDPKSFMFSDDPRKDSQGDFASGGRVAGQMVQVGYNAMHEIYWKWPVAAYIVTKDIAAGLMMLLAFGYWFGAQPSSADHLLWGAVSLFFTAITTALLVYDLKKPLRFLSIVFRPQWRSWLARGAFILTAFTGMTVIHTGIHLLASDWISEADTLQSAILYFTAFLGFFTAVYTAFLFGQAEGRDLWQSQLLPVLFFVRSTASGAALVVLLSPALGGSEEFAMWSGTVLLVTLCVDLICVLLSEVAMPHMTDVASAAARLLLKGRYAKPYWLGYMVLGRLLPCAGLILATSFNPVWALLSVVGLYVAEHCFVIAPQHIPNS